VPAAWRTIEPRADPEVNAHAWRINGQFRCLTRTPRRGAGWRGIVVAEREIAFAACRLQSEVAPHRTGWRWLLINENLSFI
jgi:hypothetical protein